MFKFLPRSGPAVFAEFHRLIKTNDATCRKFSTTADIHSVYIPNINTATVKREMFPITKNAEFFDKSTR
jgi:hypothetical protein